MPEFAVRDSEIGPVRTVRIDSLRVAGSPRTAGESAEHVRALAETTAELPPIIVHRREMRVLDGRHRLRAAEMRGRQHIDARFFDGPEDDAFVLSVHANVTSGLPLPLADRKAAAARIVGSHPHWSDRMIGTTTGLSAATVARIRLRGADAGPPIRLGHDGRVRPVNGEERRRLARALFLDEPGLSLREVARRVGISPETARSVRGELRGVETERTPAPAVPPPDPTAVVRQLRGDPLVRFTESGRELLRLLDANTLSAQRWATIADSVPGYCRDTTARVALEYARAWHTFAEQLERTTASEAS